MTTVYPVMGKGAGVQYIKIEIAQHILRKFDDADELNLALSDMVLNIKKDNGEDVFPYGGYLEKRDFYQTSAHFGVEEKRNIHLGIDVWAQPGTPVFSPLPNGIVHSVKYNAAQQDYGWCIIVKYPSFYLLFGHLDENTASLHKAGDGIGVGQVVGYIGDVTVNGGWEPHLHLQQMLTIGEWWGDYPGVCSHRDLDYYTSNCPDPTVFVLGD